MENLLNYSSDLIPPPRYEDEFEHHLEIDFEAIGYVMSLLAKRPRHIVRAISSVLERMRLYKLDIAPDSSKLRFDKLSSEYKRTVSNEFGEGISVIFMNKLLDVDFKTVVRVSDDPIPRYRGRMPDFRGFSSKAKYIFEAKGTTTIGHQKEQIKRGKEQIEQYPEPADFKCVLSSFLSSGEEVRDSHLFVEDPNEKNYKYDFEDGYHRAMCLHYSRVMKLLSIGDFFSAFDFYSKQLENVVLERNYFKNEFKLKSDVPMEDLYHRKIKKNEYFGDILYPKVPNKKAQTGIFVGLDKEIFTNLVNGNLSRIRGTKFDYEVDIEKGIVKLPDGLIFVENIEELDNEEKKW